jgi:hypothetical protein
LVFVFPELEGAALAEKLADAMTVASLAGVDGVGV